MKNGVQLSNETAILLLARVARLVTEQRMDPNLVSTKILPQLPIESIVSLAATQCYDSDRSDDIWNQRLIAMGYPPVDILTQGFYFCVNGNSDPAMQFRNIVFNKVDAHVTAFLNHHSKLWDGDKRATLESLLTEGFCHNLTPNDVTPYARELIRDIVFRPHIDEYHATVAAGDLQEAKDTLVKTLFLELDGITHSPLQSCNLLNDIKAELVSTPAILLTCEDLLDYPINIIVDLLRYYNYPTLDMWLHYIDFILNNALDAWKDPNAGWRQYDEEIVRDGLPEVTDMKMFKSGDKRYLSYLYVAIRQRNTEGVIALLIMYNEEIRADPPRLLLEDAITYDKTNIVAPTLKNLLGIKL